MATTDALTFCRERLAEIKAACDAATPGPLKADLDIFSGDTGIEACVSNEGITLLFTAECDQHPGGPADPAWKAARESQEMLDAKFFAASRTWLPALRDAWETELERHSCSHHSYPVNQHCIADDSKWPCPTVLVIARALGFAE